MSSDTAVGGIRRDGTVLGFDVGSRRIGVAVGSAFGHGARAVAVIDVHNDQPNWSALDKVQREWRPAGLIVGDPLTLEGGDQPARQRAHVFARALHARYRLPVVLVDERASSIEAAQRFAADRAEGRKRRRDAEALDAVAAAIIVERWLAAPDEASVLSELPSA
jgi:putative Holliday junction resolvase